MRELCMGIGGSIPPSREGFMASEVFQTPVMIQEKADGIWCAAIKKSNEVELYSKTSERKKNGQLHPTIKALTEFMPKGSVLIGELGFGSSKETAWAQKNGFHRFLAFDIFMWEGTDFEKVDTRMRFISLKAKLKSAPELLKIPKTLILDNFAPSQRSKMAWEFYKEVLDRDGEGAVVKELDSVYIPGTKSKQWHKIKKIVSKEYVVLGFTKSNAPTFVKQGMNVASIECGLYIDGELTHVMSVSGFPFELRKEFSDNPKKYIGKVVEIGGNEIFPSGAIRHPFFCKWRDGEVKPEECILT